MKTYATKEKDIKRQWQVVDATGKTLGKLATEVANMLQGKNKAYFARTIDTGDYVVVINAAKVRVTGNKAKEKMYYRHSSYPGGLKVVNFERLLQTHPTRIIEFAVKGMLPKNNLGRAMYRKLKVYEGNTHPHQAQVAGSEVPSGGAEKS
jgi:large subunit ribosomal protein L13